MSREKSTPPADVATTDLELGRGPAPMMQLTHEERMMTVKGHGDTHRPSSLRLARAVTGNRGILARKRRGRD